MKKTKTIVESSSIIIVAILVLVIIIIVIVSAQWRNTRPKPTQGRAKLMQSLPSSGCTSKPPIRDRGAATQR
jgi:hypothetical protein